jgi:hypothetical protein
MLAGRIVHTSSPACSGRAAARRPAAPAPAPRRGVRARGKLNDAALVPVMERGEMSQYPDAPGVYAVYNANDELQYIGLSRKV